MSRAKKTLRRLLSFVTVLVSILLVGALTIRAQGTGTPINIGENKTGNVIDASTPVAYSVTVAAPMSINIQLLAISPGFAPTFRVIDPGGVVMLDASNPGTQTIAQASPNLSSPGTYTIEVSSANGATGQFLISVQPGAPLAPPQPLAPGQPANGTVTRQNTRQAYSFSGSPTDVLLLTMRSVSTTSGPVVTLRDANTGETLGLISARLAGIAFRIATGPTNYLVEVNQSGGDAPEPFVICLATESGTVTCPGTAVVAQLPSPTPTPFVAPTAAPTIFVPPALTPTFSPVQIDPNGSCQVASARGVSINVRSGPGTNYSIVGQLVPNATGLVLGRLADNSWFQVNVGGVLGWVSATVVILGGNCAGVTVVTLPTAVPPTATNTPGDSLTATQMSIEATATAQANLYATGTQIAVEATQSAALTATAAAGGGGGGGATLVHFPPIRNLTLIAPIQVVPLNPKLDYTASANYGEANLSAGFSPDPYSVGMTTGGNVDVSYLGGSCSGYATTHPDLRINFGGGGASLLRIYFVGSNGDATIVINDPYGNFYCVDDSFGTVNPTIDFNNPAGGSYDVWVGSYAANTTISGTLYLTENSGNHP